MTYFVFGILSGVFCFLVFWIHFLYFIFGISDVDLIFALSVYICFLVSSLMVVVFREARAVVKRRPSINSIGPYSDITPSSR